jgi:hypothetical protein
MHKASRPGLAAALAVTLLMPSSAARADQAVVARPTSSVLSERVNDGLATVWVTLGSKTEKPKLEFKVHRSPTTAWRMVGSWIGECIPDREQLERWQREHPRHPHRRLWAKALARKQYEAVVFLKRVILDTWPSCNREEAMSMRYTDVHEDYAAYRRQVLAVLPTLPPVPLTSSCGLLLE